MALVTIPAAPNFNSTPLVARYGASIDESPFTLQHQVQSTNREGFMFQATLPLMVRADADPWIAFFDLLEGSLNSFLWGPPYAATAKGVATGTPRLNGAATLRSNTLVTDGWTNDTTDILKAGDLIQISNQLYRVRSDVNSGSTTGPATLDVWPGMRQAYADDTAITVSSPQGEWRLAEHSMRIAINTAYHVGPITFTAVEKITV